MSKTTVLYTLEKFDGRTVWAMLKANSAKWTGRKDLVGEWVQLTLKAGTVAGDDGSPRNCRLVFAKNGIIPYFEDTPLENDEFILSPTPFDGYPTN